MKNQKENLTKQEGNLDQPIVSGSAFSDEVKQMVNEIWRLSRYTRNHDNILYNYQDIAKIIRGFRKKHYR